jgi:hypothetical protein
LAQILVFPWFGLEADLTQHLTIGVLFVGVLLVRGYVLQRLFEAFRLGLSKKSVGSPEAIQDCHAGSAFVNAGSKVTHLAG